jgi:hypothetical protein
MGPWRVKRIRVSSSERAHSRTARCRGPSTSIRRWLRTGRPSSSLAGSPTWMLAAEMGLSLTAPRSRLRDTPARRKDRTREYWFNHLIRARSFSTTSTTTRRHTATTAPRKSFSDRGNHPKLRKCTRWRPFRKTTRHQERTRGRARSKS